MTIVDLLQWTFESNVVDRKIFHYDNGDFDDNNDNDDDDVGSALPSLTVPFTSYKVWFEPPSIVFSIQIIWILLLQILIGAVLAVIIYYGIYLPKTTPVIATTAAQSSSIPSSVSNMNNMDHQQQKRGEIGIQSRSHQHSSPPSSLSSFSATILAYGVVIPIALTIPFIMIDQFDIRNIGFRLAWVSMPLTVTLRCLEALYGFVPTHGGVAQHGPKSLFAYVMHVAFILQPKYYDKDADVTVDGGSGSGSPDEGFSSQTATEATIPGDTTTGIRNNNKINNGNDGRMGQSTENCNSISRQHQRQPQQQYQGDDGRKNIGTIPVNFKFMFNLIFQNYFCWVMIYAILYHMTKPYGFYPFTSLRSDVVDIGMKTTTTSSSRSPTKWFSWDLPLIYDTFVQAYMLNATLSLSMTGVSALGGILTGVQMDDSVTDHPLVLSESVSDFWGRRWNNLIHVALKQGVYKPVRSTMESTTYSTYGRPIASLAVFFVSGLYHEYVWALIFYATQAQRREGGNASTTTSCCPSCYCDARLGKQLFFFGWNGLLIALEYWIGPRVSKLIPSNLLPRLVRSHLIVLLALPVGHLFTGDLTRAGYFDHIRPAIPVIVRIQQHG